MPRIRLAKDGGSRDVGGEEAVNWCSGFVEHSTVLDGRQAREGPVVTDADRGHVAMPVLNGTGRRIGLMVLVTSEVLSPLSPSEKAVPTLASVLVELADRASHRGGSHREVTHMEKGTARSGVPTDGE